MLELLQQTAATDTVGWVAGILTAGVFVVACIYALAMPLIPVIIAINLIRRAVGLPQLR